MNHALPSLSPRTAKEADALAEAGHDVCVVGVAYGATQEAKEARLFGHRPWRRKAVNYGNDSWAGGLRWFSSGLASHLNRATSRVLDYDVLAEKAFVRYGHGLLELAIAERADMYIAHNLQNLPVAARAAATGAAGVGFDVEDYHLDEDAGDPPWLQGAKTRLMRTYVPRCRYLTTTSEAMADAIVESLGVARPHVIRNVFPLNLRDRVPSPSNRPRVSEHGVAYSAYWFSQVVGLDRGLQDFVRVMQRLVHPVSLHLRAHCPDKVRRALLRLAREHGVADRIRFDARIDPDALVPDAARHDFGLALEQPLNRNKELTISNKLFLYLLAGVLPIATTTIGQREVMRELSGHGIEYEPGDVDGLSRRVNALLATPELLLAGKEAAWRLAEQRFCWEHEKQVLVSVVEDAQRQRRYDRPRGMRAVEFDVPILMYHNLDASASGRMRPYTVTCAAFERHLALLDSLGYSTLSFDDLRAIVVGERPPTNREVLLTFDDGYESFLRLAVPALLRRGMTATVFVVAGELGGQNHWDLGTDIESRRLLSANEVRDVQALGMSVGVHGWAHRDLLRCSDRERSIEISRSKEVLEELLGRPVTTFAYPFGHHSASLFQALKAAGYRDAVTMFSEESHVTSNPFAMRRVYVHPGDGLVRFPLKLSRAYLRHCALRGIPRRQREGGHR